MDAPLFQSVLIAVFVGVASGAIGSFIIIKRMALVGDALSHVALPGIALAVGSGIDPFWGVIVFLLTAAVFVWWLQGRTDLPADAIVGLLFTASLAGGILMLADHEIVESLFGGFPEIDTWFLALILSAAALLAAFTLFFSRRFLFATLSPDLAKADRVGSGTDLAILLIFSAVIALGIKLVGTLLMGALTIIPAAIAKNLSKSMRTYIILSSLLGGIISVAGVLLAYQKSLPPGPAIILIGIGIFIVSLFFARK